MKLLSARAGAVLAVGMAGCASNSTERLTGEAAHLVHPGTELGEARAALARHGFACSPGGPGEVTCSRMRPSDALATCVQRVNLGLDATGARVTALVVPPIPCTGL